MISRLTGLLEKVNEHEVIVDTGGVGYSVLVPPASIPFLMLRQGQVVTLYTVHYLQYHGSTSLVPILIGFETPLERDFFEVLTTVDGLGPKAALRAMSVPVVDIAKAIENEDVLFLKMLPGIGKQKAQEIIAKLKGKVTRFVVGNRIAKEVGLEEPGEPSGKTGTASDAAKEQVNRRPSEPQDRTNLVVPESREGIALDAVEILVQLDYKRNEAERMVREAIAKVPSFSGVEDLIRVIFRGGANGTG